VLVPLSRSCLDYSVRLDRQEGGGGRSKRGDETVTEGARATGEGLQEKVDLAMPDAVLDMRFAHFMGEFIDDEGFLQATYQAALQVEKKKALKQAREQWKGQAGGTGGSARSEEKKKEGNRADTGRKSSEVPRDRREGATRPSRYRQPGRWATKDDALRGVPKGEHEVYFKNRDGCWHCGQTGHRTYECFAHTTRRGTVLPRAPWKAAGVSEGNPGRPAARSRLSRRRLPEQRRACWCCALGANENGGGSGGDKDEP